VEALTNQIETKILNEIDEIEMIGGIVKAVENGWMHRRIANHIQHEQKMIEDGRIKVVGRNIYANTAAKEPKVKVHEYSQELRQEMCEKLARLRRQRDNVKVMTALGTLKTACQKGGNVMQYTIDAARVGATKGEMRRAFTDAFGTWKPPISI
jgi:methylmalonyl-CoA mutase N-terminal domain/subunit